MHAAAEHHFDATKIKAIIGLGNPGAAYLRHRHGIGFRVLDALAEHCGLHWRHGEIMMHAQGQLSASNSHEVILVKPLTFMNNSGRVIGFLQKKGIKPDEIMVVHDELEKPFGQAHVRWGGSARGHNGLRSIIGVIGQDFWRLRIGVGRPENKEEVPQYVLSNFPPDQERVLPEVFTQIFELIGIRQHAND